MKQLFIYFVLFCNLLNSQTINTVAGVNSAGFGGDGSSALSAQLNFPMDVVVDTIGNIFVADNCNNRIRKINYSSGIITTIAGSGTSFGAGSGSYSGDGGSATSATLNNPYGIALDSIGNIYISDHYNQRIRKITVSSGVISTVAGTGSYGYTGDGGLATLAKISQPYGITLDKYGNIYFADWNNHCVRKVTVSSGNISTIAGNGVPGYSGDGGLPTSAQLNYPTDILIDKTGNIFIADQYNNRIRKISEASGLITTIAGNGNGGCIGDGGLADTAEIFRPIGLAMDSSSNLYFGDSYCNKIRKISSSNGLVSTVAGGGNCATSYCGDGGQSTSARLSQPQGIAINKTGDLFIADQFNDKIRKVSNVMTVNISDNYSLDKKYLIFPNPSDGHFSLSGTESLNGTIEIIDAVGRQVFFLKNNNKTESIDVTHLQSGTYFVRIIQKNSLTNCILKIIK